MQEQAFLPVHPKRTKIAEALSLLRHTAILRTLRRIEPVPKYIEQPLRAGCRHVDADRARKRARCAAESTTGTRRDEWLRVPGEIKEETSMKKHTILVGLVTAALFVGVSSQSQVAQPGIGVAADDHTARENRRFVCKCQSNHMVDRLNPQPA